MAYSSVHDACDHARVTDDATSPPLLEDPVRVAHFRIIGRLGVGGMGVVYRAEDEKLRRIVALKLLPDPGESEERRHRFVREARSAAAITHPNVATVHAIDEADGRVYIAMELVEGESLRARMGRGPLDLPAAKDIALQIAKGLAAAHDKGIVHRDLKPENVMVTPSGLVKLLDFGLAKGAAAQPASSKTGAEQAKTETLVTSDEGRVMGTPSYMSPEQGMGETLDVRSDVFSLGIVMYEMLAGARPFAGASTGAVLVAIARDAPAPLRERAPHVDEWTADVVMRCLAKERQQRFASAGEVVAALTGTTSPKATTQAHAPLLPVKPAAVTTAATAVPTPRRQRGAMLAGASLAALAIVGGLEMWHLGGARRAPAPPPDTSVFVPPVALPAVSVTPKPTTYGDRRLTTYPAEDRISAVALSPDGQQLAFSDQDGFWVLPVAGGPRRSLGAPLEKGDVPGYVAFFADGTRVLGSSYNDHSGAKGWIATLDGAPASRTRDVDGQVAPSHDGQRLAECNLDGTVKVAPIAGGPWFQVGQITPKEQCVPHWSADDRQLLVGTINEITAIAADGHSSETLYRYDFGALSPAFGWPDAHHVVLGGVDLRARGGVVSELELDDAGHASGLPRILWSGGSQTYAVSTAGGRIAVLRDQRQSDVFVARLSADGRRLDGLPERLSQSEADDALPAWSGDGRVLYWSGRDQIRATYVQAVHGSTAELLVRDTIPWTLQPLTTGDLLVTRGRYGDASGMVATVVVGPRGERELASGELVKGERPTVRCGGRDPARCVLWKKEQGTSSIAHLDATSGKLDPPFFRDPAITDVAVSPDGATVVVTTNTDLLTTVRVADGETHRFSTTPTASSLVHVAYTSDGRGLFVTASHVGDAVHALMRVDLHGRGAILYSTSTAMLSDPAPSPDGRWIAFQELASAVDVYLLEPR
jgi:hypothetical protein